MTISAHNVQSAFRHAGMLCRTCQPVTAERIKFGRFHHTGIGRGQRCGDAASRHFQRVVPGNDLGRNTERLVGCEIEIVAAKRDRTPFNSLRLIAVIFKIAYRAVGLDERFPIGLA